MKALTPIARTVAVVALAVLATSCETGGTSSNGKASAARGGSSLAAEGKQLYLTRCTACHAAEPVGDFTAAEWRSLMPEMAEEAKLNPSQQRAVLEYVLSASQ